MFYKNWPYWLKGGTISLIIILILFFSSNLISDWDTKNCSDVCQGSPIAKFLLSVVVIALWPIKFFRRLHAENELQIYVYNFLAFVLPIVQVFAVGAILGFIYGKIINKFKRLKR